MYCMKCGKEIPEKQAFCDDCLAVMEQFPVKPETRILLPNRPVPNTAKKTPTRKKVPTVEERMARMRRAIQWLSVSLAVAIFALFLSITLLADAMAPDTSGNAIGQNYNTTDTASNTD